MEFIEKLKQIRNDFKRNGLEGVDEQITSQICAEIDAHLAHINEFSDQSETQGASDKQLSSEKTDINLLSKIFSFCDEDGYVPLDSNSKEKNERVVIFPDTSFLKILFYTQHYNEITSLTICVTGYLKAHLALCKNKFPKLEEFCLENMYEAYDDIQLIADAFPNLKSLILDIKIANGDEVVQLINRLPNLVNLSYEGDIDGNWLSLLQPKLESLYLIPCSEVNKEDLNVFLESKGHYLKRFWFSSPFCSSNSSVFRRLTECLPNVEALTVIFTKNSSIEFSLSRLTKLNEFQLSCGSLTLNTSLTPPMTGVTKLDLSIKSITDEDFAKLLLYFPSTENFHLKPSDKTVIGENTLKVLTSLPIKEITVEMFTPEPFDIDDDYETGVKETGEASKGDKGSKSEQEEMVDMKEDEDIDNNDDSNIDADMDVESNVDLINLFQALPNCVKFEIVGDGFGSNELRRVFKYFTEDRSEQTVGSIDVTMRMGNYKSLEKLGKEKINSNKVKTYYNDDDACLEIHINGS